MCLRKLPYLVTVLFLPEQTPGQEWFPENPSGISVETIWNLRTLEGVPG